MRPQTILLLLTSLACLSGAVPPQQQETEHLCGTQLTKAHISQQLQKLNSGKQKAQTTTPCLDRTLSIIAYIASDPSGVPMMSGTQITSAIAQVNSYFDECCLSFEVCEIVEMPETRWFKWSSQNDEPDCINIHYRPGYINMYFAQEVTSGAGIVGGYAYLPGGPDVIVIRGGSGMVSVIAHELGHFFGLYHTFETGLGTELVNGTNCTAAGDLVCDTEADPYYIDPSTGLPAFNLDSDCNIVPPAQDSNGDWYLPPTDNIMSYYNGICSRSFTNGQINRMTNQYLTQRNYLK